MTLTRYNPATRFCSAIRHGNTVYLSGQVAKKASEGSVAEQTAEVLQSIDALLEQAGTDKSKILMVNIWLPDISKFNEMNAVWDTWVAKDALPCRATVEARLANPKLLVEIAVVAAV